MGTFLAGFVFGTLIGASLLMLYSIHSLKKAKGELLNKLKTKAAEMSKSMVDNADLRASVIERLKEASKLAEEQNALRAQAEMPSKNSLHSRHKNGLIYQIQELEQQKISILKSVLGDGYNPTITIIREGGVREEVSLADYIAGAEQNVSQSPSAPVGPKKAGKFVIINGGKDDGGGTTH
jgi:hypothetical protein